MGSFGNYSAIMKSDFYIFCLQEENTHMDTILIGIAGGSGSGKTTLANSLVNYFGEDEVSILRHDNYYKRHDDLSYEERSQLNYDHPDAFDTELLCGHIRDLKAGRPVEMPVYDYSVHNRSDQTTTVHPNPVIILEGILIFAEVKTRSRTDYGLPRDAVTAQKRLFLTRAAQGYLKAHRDSDAHTRFDVVEVYTRPLRIVHLPGAF